ncbi:hypothetical protein BC826DRAFT_1024730 [Russula brevipes]|nr:hypothetical protein BC826DRAFT_1024730 [Russula brevipes]
MVGVGTSQRGVRWWEGCGGEVVSQGGGEWVVLPWGCGVAVPPVILRYGGVSWSVSFRWGDFGLCMGSWGLITHVSTAVEGGGLVHVWLFLGHCDWVRVWGGRGAGGVRSLSSGSVVSSMAFSLSMVFLCLGSGLAAFAWLGCSVAAVGDSRLCSVHYLRWQVGVLCYCSSGVVRSCCPRWGASCWEH